MGTLVCRGCSAKAETNAVGGGCTLVGRAIEDTGWTYSACNYTQKGVWLCSPCANKTKELVMQLLAITKTPYIHMPFLIDEDILKAWYKENDK